MLGKRLDYIDYAKALTIICVVVGHVLGFDLYGKNVSYSPLFKWIYTFHMPCFIFLSGLVSTITIKRENICLDLYKRTRRMLVPAICVGLIYAFLFYSVKDFFFDEMKAGYWYMLVLFELYMINYIPALITNKKVIVGFYFICFSISIYLYRHLYAIPHAFSGLLSFVQLIKYLPFFFIANMIRKYNWSDTLFSAKSLIVCLLIWIVEPYLNNCFAYISYIFYDSHDFISHLFSIVQDIVVLLLTLCKVICVISLCKIFSKKEYLKSQILFIGRNTLFIYLFHYFFIQLLIVSSFNDWFRFHTGICVDIMTTAIPTALVILGSLTIKWIVFRNKLITRLIFFNTEENK